jgi:hypothetical protein
MNRGYGDTRIWYKTAPPEWGDESGLCVYNPLIGGWVFALTPQYNEEAEWQILFLAMPFNWPALQKSLP